MSQTPGKTQAVQFYLVNDRFYLVDLPGYGYAKVPQSVKRTWGALVHGYVESSDALRLIFLLLDVRRIPSDEDLQMHAWTQSAGIDERILLTKSDKLSNNGIAQQKRAIAATLELDQEYLIETSAETNRGIEETRRQIATRL